MIPIPEKKKTIAWKVFFLPLYHFQSFIPSNPLSGLSLESHSCVFFCFVLFGFKYFGSNRVLDSHNFVCLPNVGFNYRLLPQRLGFARLFTNAKTHMQR